MDRIVDTNSITIWGGLGRSDIGDVREENQDSFLVLDDCGLWCVADGMGGHKEGGIASHLVTQSLETLLTGGDMALQEISHKVIELLSDANESLYELSKNFYEKGDLVGTTVIVLIIRNKKGCVIWAGDSRLYRLRGARYDLLSRDHTQLEEMRDRGMVGNDKESKDHYASNILTRAIGVERRIELDYVEIDVEDGDVFLLCSDGLSNVVEQMEMAKTIYYSEDKERALSNLINMALARRADDNVTAIIVDGNN